jgi:hypothetical protein
VCLEQVFGYCEVREAVLEKPIVGVVDIGVSWVKIQELMSKTLKNSITHRRSSDFPKKARERWIGYSLLCGY